MRRILILFVLLLMLFGHATAEVSCICGQSKCLCYIQFGDEGQAVQRIEEALIKQGYLAFSDRAEVFGEAMQRAVIAFQSAHELPATGMMDNETLTWLLWGMSPDALDEAEPLSMDEPVWIPTDGGIRHHRRAGCSNMYDPRLVSRRNAIAMEMLSCGRCKPNGFNTELITR